MLIPKKNRLAVYKYLFNEGVLQAEKDHSKPKHSDDLDIPNLQVIKLMQSFTSKGYVTERFAWRHYYWFLTDEGITYLREYLGVPAEVVPATLKKSTKQLERLPPRPAGRREGGGFGNREGGREGYRREGGFGRGGAPGGDADKAGAPAAYQPRFGRGAGAPQ